MKNLKNLKKLLNHLKKGKLIHGNFDNGCFNRGGFILHSKVPFCKLSGNALGEMPAISKKWTFNSEGQLYFDGLEFECNSDSSRVIKYFGLASEEEFCHLFLGSLYLDREWKFKFSGKVLDCKSTIKDVIFTIEDFIRIKESKK